MEINIYCRWEYFNAIIICLEIVKFSHLQQINLKSKHVDSPSNQDAYEMMMLKYSLAQKVFHKRLSWFAALHGSILVFLIAAYICNIGLVETRMDGYITNIQ